jgi:A/G-specific adenine glycosylase
MKQRKPASFGKKLKRVCFRLSFQRFQKAVESLLDWFEKNARDLPWRRTGEPYAIWLSEIMLQQTQVKTVIPYWERWMRALPDIQSLASAEPETVLKLWEGLGYYSRARNAHQAAREIVARHDGVFPSCFEDVLALPGVGRYTAGAICSIAFNQPAPILDGNVARVLARVYAIGGDVKSQPVNSRLWKLAADWVQCASQLPDRRLRGVSDCALQIAENLGFNPARFAQQAGTIIQVFLARAGNCSRLNQSLMELGALICAPNQPLCDSCPLSTLCKARLNNCVNKYPSPKKRVPATPRRFVAFIVERNGRFLARQRPDSGVNSGLWEFPNVETAPRASQAPSNTAPFVIVSEHPVFAVTHSITRHRIRLEAFDAQWRGEKSVDGKWMSLKEMQKLPFTGAHRKIEEYLVARMQGNG